MKTTKKIKPKFDDMRHEAGDRASVVLDHLTRDVGEHPFVASRKHLMKLATRAEDALADLYQAIWNTER